MFCFFKRKTEYRLGRETEGGCQSGLGSCRVSGETGSEEGNNNPDAGLLPPVKIFAAT
jgi:hypothetical protein